MASQNHIDLMREWRQGNLEKVKAWRQAGLLDPPVVLERLSRVVEDNSDPSALENLRANFAAVCSPDETLTEASLSSWIAANLAADCGTTGNPVTAVPALAAAVPLLFRAMRRLSTHPFTAAVAASSQPETAAGITLDGLLRVLFWAVPADEYVCRTLRLRAPAEQRRALFQALATPDAAAAEALPFDEARWRRLARRRARDFPAHKTGGSWAGGADGGHVWCTRDDAGDEVVYDAVDVLHTTQEDPGMGVAQVEWASFRAVATELARGEPALRDLVVAPRELRALVEAMVPLQGWMTYAGERLPVAEADAACVDAIVAVFEAGAGGPELEIDPVTGRGRIGPSFLKEAGWASGWCPTGANYEMFDRALSMVAPALLDPFHLLLEAFTKAPPRVHEQPKNADPAQTALGRQPGDGILSYGRLAQLRTFLQGRAGEETDDLLLKWVWDSSSAASTKNGAAEDLVKSMRSATGETFLLLRGSRTDGSSDRTCTFGFYSARGARDESAIVNNYQSYGGVCPAAIFQAGPVQDVFLGALGKPAWAVEDDGALRFGDPGHGASLRVDISTGRALFGQKLAAGGPNGDDAAVYRISTWRGDWDVEIAVERLEVWFQDDYVEM